MNGIAEVLAIRRTCYLLAFAAVFLSGCTTSRPASGVAGGVPESTQLTYVVVGRQGKTELGGVHGDLRWKRIGDTYDATLRLTYLYRTVNLQHSSGQIDGTGLVPRDYSETRRQKETAARFDGQHGSATSSAVTPSAPLRAGAQDPLSVVFQLGALLASDPSRHSAGNTLDIQVAGRSTPQTWLVSFRESETQDVPAGRFLAQKVVRLPRSEFDDKVEIWFAPQLHHLPIRIRQTMTNGDFLDMALQSSNAPSIGE